jgi:hypothetical protein
LNAAKVVGVTGVAAGSAFDRAGDGCCVSDSVALTRYRCGRGRLKHGKEQLFYEFQLDEVVPDDHPVREIAAVLGLSWVRAEACVLLLAARPPVD